MSLPVSPKLFGLLTEYATDVEGGKVKLTRVASTSPALVFCENFYAQFFQNELGEEIKTFTQDTKRTAVRLRLRMKKKKTATSTIQLITWFEKLCDIYPNVLALGYGGGTKVAFVEFHEGYLLTLLERAIAWAKSRKYVGIEKSAEVALAALKRALRRPSK